MPEIHVLSKDTIDKIAAGEVVERPSSVVKELVENAIDAGASAVTVEIKDGGTSLIRITDNGCGIEADQIEKAFLRHSTSKIRSAEDLMGVRSLGFRGEALSSIAAVARVELITKTIGSLTGTRFIVEGSLNVLKEEIGAPDGTTFLVRDLFYNVPARKKFLKSNQTEGVYISDIVEKLALSHPNVSFKYIIQNQTKLHTSGNGNIKDVIYHIYGREIAANLLPMDFEEELIKVHGFIAKPSVTRGNRNYENYFINGRYIKSRILAKAIEEAYKNFLMQHQYPFTMLYFELPGENLDVNVHPQKMEIRFDHQEEIYKLLYQNLFTRLSQRELIPQVPISENKPEVKVFEDNIPEPFEQRRINDIRKSISKDSPYEPKFDRVSEAKTPYRANPTPPVQNMLRPEDTVNRDFVMRDLLERQKSQAQNPLEKEEPVEKEAPAETIKPIEKEVPYHEMTLSEIDSAFMAEESRKKHRIIGQLFETYWLIEFEDKLFIIDQHAAHEKVLYEKTMKLLKDKELTSQMISPPIFISLDAREEKAFLENQQYIEDLGYAIENFGGREYIIRGVPANLFNLDMKDLFIQMLDEFYDYSGRQTPDLIREKVASMSCKAAVKGNNRLSLAEVDCLISDLLALDNPYNCPHGRPTIISMSKYEIEKKFKRIVS